MDYATIMLRDHMYALEKSHECLVRETSKTAQKVEVLEDKAKELARNHKNMETYVVVGVNRDDSLEIEIVEVREELWRMQQRIDQLERAPSVAKRRRRVTICA